MTELVRVKTALISVSDKSGLDDLARALHRRSVRLLSTGGTFRALADAGCEPTEVSAYTGFPEMMDGRVKTLHPRVHGGLLGRAGTDDAVMAREGIEAIDLLVVNLYPFEQTVARDGCTLADAIENIDIGGPAMVRSAAKNHDRVAVVVDPADYAAVVAELDENDGALRADTRFRLAVRAFEAIARYDAAIANYLGSIRDDGARDKFPQTLTLPFSRAIDMRYGENPHQDAALYVAPKPARGTIATATLLQGRALSYNNVADTDAALQCVKSFDEPACVIVKHANPCGVAEAADVATAYRLAFECDPTSAFGGIIAFNRPLPAALAEEIVEKQFVEVIIAPGIEPGAAEAVRRKKNVRLLDCGSLDFDRGFDYKRVEGGLLVQDRDLALANEEESRVVTDRAPTNEERRDLLFAWKIAKFVKSNAIVYARDNRSIGIGAGQMSRVYSARLAGLKAEAEGLTVPGSVMASDAFFPFRDGIDAAAAAGITAVIQPGGSVRDDEVIRAANEAGMAMVFTGMRHFRH